VGRRVGGGGGGARLREAGGRIEPHDCGGEVGREGAAPLARVVERGAAMDVAARDQLRENASGFCSLKTSL